MKQSYGRKTEHGARLVAEIKEVADVIAEYFAKGRRMTVRQVFYQLVARNLCENTIKQYDRVCARVATGRLEGAIDWMAIEDPSRPFYLPYSVKDIEGALEDTIDQYRLDRQKTQPSRLEVWLEKDALSGILRPICEEFHVGLVVGKGSFSLTCRKKLSERLSWDGRPAVILFLADYDPAGFMFKDNIRDALELFGSPEFEIVHVALTKDQVLKYDLPPQMVKEGDTRALKWKKTQGDDVCELDAIEPGELEELLRKAIKQNLSIPKYRAMLRQEKQDKETLRSMIGKVMDE